MLKTAFRAINHLRIIGSNFNRQFTSMKSVISPEIDPCTASNYTDFSLEKTTLSLRLNWKQQIIDGIVDYHLTPKTDVNKIVLDVSHLSINNVWIDDKQVNQYEDGGKKANSALSIPIALTKNSKSVLTINFSTTSECTALQWLDPEQTKGKKAPYMFSQCQSIHARSLYPCFDTPGTKSPVSYYIQSKYPVLASGVTKDVSKDDYPKSAGEKFFSDPSDKVYFIDQQVPIPSYLVAIASGDLAGAEIGPRSQVFCEPEDLAACKYEFEEDTENFIKVAEKLVFPYEWKTYNILVLPPSFPFGGMENPNITFATPSLISGDRQNVDVISHELAHSWSGNLVSNCSWEHFWLNEGWTVYLERRILADLHGEEYRHLSGIIGWSALEASVANQPADYTKLVVDLKDGVSPDDVYSIVPYEKGSIFLWFLEKAVGGKEHFDPFIPYYFNKFKYKSLDSYQFKDTVYEFFKDKKQELDAIDWDSWYFSPGLPPKPEFNTILVDEIHSLADKWIAANTDELSQFKSTDIEKWTSTQCTVFLDILNEKINNIKSEKHEFIIALRKAYAFDKSKNAEVIYRFYLLALRTQTKEEYENISAWLGTIGRMKYVRPVFKLLTQVDRTLAVKTFEKFHNFYHPICRAMLRKDLDNLK